MFDLQTYLLGKAGQAPPTAPLHLPSYLLGKSASGKIQEITGTPPLIFNSDGSNLVDYTIYGANTRSNNLLQIVPDMLDAENWEGIEYSPGSVFFMYYELSQAQAQEILANASMAGTVYLKPNGSYYNGEVFAITKVKQSTVNDVYRLLQNDGTTLDFSWSTTGWSSVYLTIGYGNKITPTNKQTLINEFFNNYDIMLNSGTEPLPYAPYWVPGVGDKTVNLFDKNGDNLGYYQGATGVYTSSSIYRHWKVPVQPGDVIRSTRPGRGSGCLFKNGEYAGFINYGADSYVVPDGADEATNNYRDYVWDSAMVTLNQPLPTSYVPYGYQIPLTINAQTYTIYLDAPLGEGESISLADTGIDIPTVEGENTLSVDTTVQPENVTIVYNKGG